MIAKALNEITINFTSVLDGILFAETSCDGYEHFKLLPQVIEFRGRRLGKSGWNSDRNICYYRSDKTTAKVV